MPGNGPLAEAVKNTKGAVGYVELLYALRNPGLKMGKVKSHDGEYLSASLEGVTAAADNARSKPSPKKSAIRFVSRWSTRGAKALTRSAARPGRC